MMTQRYFAKPPGKDWMEIDVLGYAIGTSDFNFSYNYEGWIFCAWVKP